MTKVAFDAELYDTNNNFDSTTNRRYTAPVNGFYMFYWRVSVNGQNQTVTALYKNGSVVHRGGHVAGVSAVQGVVGSLVIQVTAADYFELYVQTTTANAFEVGSGLLYFGGILMCRT